MKHTEDDGELPVEWSGYMNQNARENDSTRKETKYVFGPLLDATPSLTPRYSSDIHRRLYKLLWSEISLSSGQRSTRQDNSARYSI